MPIYRYADGSAIRYAIDFEGQTYDLPDINDTSFFDGSHDDRAATQASRWRLGDPVELPDVLLPPAPPGEKIFGIGLNYRDHAEETGVAIPTEPVVFGMFANALVGHGEPIRLPAVSDAVDYEAELVVIIGRTARDLSPDDAADVIFGYTAGNDVSARDWQKGRPGGQWLNGKSMDTFAPVGPGVVPAAEFGDPSNVDIRLHLSGETMQSGNSRSMIFDIPTLVSHLSRLYTLRPGDLIFTGTPPGVGMARTPSRYLRPGDVCEVEIERIGVLRNLVTA